MSIFTYAFGLEQAGGGVAGYAVLQAVRFGVARGLFSNEAGQGSTAIAMLLQKPMIQCARAKSPCSVPSSTQLLSAP